MTDFSFLPSDFSATEITILANTQDAKQYLAERYGFGCVSINVRKSAAPELADSFEFQNLTYA
jgi:CDP-glycerol glycerophosphotransferase (TagB/SpsB family)